MASGRPVGVWLQGGDTLGDVNFNYSSELYMAEVPLPYSGDVENSVAVLVSAGTFYVFKADNSGFAGDRPMVRRGDRVKFNYRGPSFEITNVNTAPANPPFPAGTTQVNYALNGYPAPRGGTVPYQVFRQAERTGASIELPTGICVDLRSSGMGPGNPAANWNSPADSATPADPSTHDPPPGVEFQLKQNEGGDASVLILFSPDGHVQSVTRNVAWFSRDESGGARRGATDRAPRVVHLLIGKLDQMDVAGTLPFSSHDPMNETLSYNNNLADPASLWVTVGVRSGNVASSENNFLLQPNFTSTLRACRTFASQTQNLGAR